MPSSVLEQLVSRSRRLYSLPAVAMQVVELTNQPAVDAKELKECIENDPAMTTKLLRVVNSSLFGLSRQVTDLNQALALMGTKPLKLLVLGFSLPKELFSEIDTEVLEQYWRRTVIKAVAARELAATHWDVSGDDAFIAGLLQDLGMLVLIQDLGDTYVAFLERVSSSGASVLKLETDTLGFNHTTLSARLLDHWGLPESIVQDVGQPFDIETLTKLPKDEQGVPQILHMADLVAEFLTRERPNLLNELIDVGKRYKDFSIEELETLIESLELKVPQLAEVLSVGSRSEAAYSSILARVYGQLCNVAESVSLEMLGDGVSHLDVEAHEFSELLKQAQALQGEVGDAAEQATNAAAPLPNARRQSMTASRVPATNQPAASVATIQRVSAPELLSSVEAAVKSCRQARCGVSLVMIELDNADAIVNHIGAEQSHRVMDRIKDVMQTIVDQDGQVVQVDTCRAAVILEGFQRNSAVELTRQMTAHARDTSTQLAAAIGHAMSFSAGIASLAMPSKNFPCQELIDAAERCLQGAQLSGGDLVKSIDID